MEATQTSETTPHANSDATPDASGAAGTDDATCEVILTQMAALGIDPEDLARYARGERTTSRVNTVRVGAFIKDVMLPACSKGQHKAWKPYVTMFADGYPHLCACFCDACLEAFRGDSIWTPCPCVAAGECHCSTDMLTAGEVQARSCLEHFHGYGDMPIADVAAAHIDTAGGWAQTRAQKRTAVRNGKRAGSGRSTYRTDGRVAREHVRAGMSRVMSLALGMRETGVTTNVALQAQVKRRQPVQTRLYDADQLDELLVVILTGGGNDPELDLLLVSFILETGSRRGGPIGLVIGDLMFNAGRVRLGEKNGITDLQPISRDLLEMLLGHAIRRGGVVIANPHSIPLEDITIDDVLERRVTLRTDAPVFYYQPRQRTDADGTTAEVNRPLTRKRFETLWGRLKRELPWLDEIHGRPHDLRKTSATFIERAFDHAVAQGWLRHHVGSDDHTGIYTGARDQEIVAAHAWLTGTAAQDTA